jgi:hypothetical protein
MSIKSATPFEIDINLPDGGEEIELEILLEADDSEEPADEQSMQASKEVVELFALAVNEQMYSSGKGKPVIASMKNVSAYWIPTDQFRHFRFHIKSVPPASFLTLLALLTQTHYANEPLRRVRIRAKKRLQKSVDHFALMGINHEIPQRIQGLPFPVNDKGLEHRQNLTVVFNFRTPISSEAYRIIRESFNIWDHIVVLGGFKFDFKEAGALPNFGTSAHISPFIVTHNIDFIDGDYSAFNALINLGARLNAEGHLLKSIEFE